MSHRNEREKGRERKEEFYFVSQKKPPSCSSARPSTRRRGEKKGKADGRPGWAGKDRGVRAPCFLAIQSRETVGPTTKTSPGRPPLRQGRKREKISCSGFEQSGSAEKKGKERSNFSLLGGTKSGQQQVRHVFCPVAVEKEKKGEERREFAVAHLATEGRREKRHSLLCPSSPVPCPKGGTKKRMRQKIYITNPPCGVEGGEERGSNLPSVTRSESSKKLAPSTSLRSHRGKKEKYTGRSGGRCCITSFSLEREKKEPCSSPSSERGEETLFLHCEKGRAELVPECLFLRGKGKGVETMRDRGEGGFPLHKEEGAG